MLVVQAAAGYGVPTGAANALTPSDRGAPGPNASFAVPWGEHPWKCGKRGKEQRVAYIHVPKTGGESLLYSLQAAHVPSCNGGTAMHPNKMPACHRRWFDEGFPELDYSWGAPIGKLGVSGPNAEIAVMEQTHDAFENYWLGERNPDCLFWLSTIRDPEGWFYSAVSQWCTNFGGGSAACRLEGLSYEKLLEMGWWSGDRIKTANVNPTRPRGHANLPFLKYYFLHDNLQTAMLKPGAGMGTDAGIFGRANWGVCDLKHFNRVFGLLPRLLPTHPKKLEDLHAHKTEWWALAQWKKKVPWSAVQAHYQVDQNFYNLVNQFGCVGSAANAELDQILKGHGFSDFPGPAPNPTASTDELRDKLHAGQNSSAPARLRAGYYA